jgi:membrane-bound lytic murein transglycosylase D
MRSRPFQPLLMSAFILLAACSSVSPRRSPPSPAESVPEIVESQPPTPVPIKPHARKVTDSWDQLRRSFAMADCDAGPAVLARARRYTRYPKQFESRLRAVLPRLMYVQQAAARHGVAGEFVLLPWVESHFRPVTTRNNRPAGMWQIMPIAAGAMGLRIDGHYDGRLNVPAATDAVMKLLLRYHEQFNDWRVADYAYNAGEFAIRRIIRKHGLPPAQPAIPHWPAPKVTREHLIKLMAIACVVREPARFNVSLPTLPKDQHLVKVKVTQPISITMAARQAGMPAKKLKHLNSAFRGTAVDTGAAPYLMIPRRHAQQLRDALQDKNIKWTPVSGAKPTTHRVRRGDNLWKIAHRYSVQISQLRRWNHLQGDTLRAGQTLVISAP